MECCWGSAGVAGADFLFFLFLEATLVVRSNPGAIKAFHCPE